MKDATELMCGETYPTLFYYIPIYIRLINVFATFETEDEVTCVKICTWIKSNFIIVILSWRKVIYSKIFKCYAKSNILAVSIRFDSITKNTILVQAMLLNPQFKDRLLQSEQKQEAINCLKEQITCESQDSDTNNNESATSAECDGNGT